MNFTDLADLEAQGGLMKAALFNKQHRALVFGRLEQIDFHGIDREVFPAVRDNIPFDGALSPEVRERLRDLDGTLRIVPGTEQVIAWIETVENTRALVLQALLLQSELGAIRPGVKADTISSRVVSGMASIGSAINTKHTYTMPDIVSLGMDLVARWELGESHAGLVPTGIEPLDRQIGGLTKGHVTVIGAPSSQGKSALAAQIGRNVALRERAEGRDSTVVFLSLDMASVMVGFRLASSMAGVNWQDVRRNVASTGAKARWVAQLKGLSSLPMVVKKLPYPTPAQLMHQCEMEAAGHKDGLALVIVDFIEQMKGEGGNETAQVGSIVMGTKVIAEHFNCPVLDLSQVSREVMKSPARIPGKEHLRQSGTIEHVAQTIIMPYYPAGHQTKDQNTAGTWPNKALEAANEKLANKGANCILIVPKDRDNEAGVTIPMIFEPRYTRFSEPDYDLLDKTTRPAKASANGKTPRPPAADEFDIPDRSVYRG